MNKQNPRSTLYEKNRDSDQSLKKQVEDFHERMSQTAQVYQRAIAFIAAERMAREQTSPSRYKVQTQLPRISHGQRVVKLIKGLAGRLFSNRSGNITMRVAEHPQNVVPPEHIVISLMTSHLTYETDQADEVVMDEYPLLDYSINKEKGNQSHE